MKDLSRGLFIYYVIFKFWVTGCRLRLRQIKIPSFQAFENSGMRFVSSAMRNIDGIIA